MIRTRGTPPPLAGLSALASQSMLTDPPQTLYAIGPEQWKAARQKGAKRQAQPPQGTTLWQLWTYDPRPLAKDGVVDLLSLTLSLQDDPDERVQLALDELRERFPW